MIRSLVAGREVGISRQLISGTSLRSMRLPAKRRRSAREGNISMSEPYARAAWRGSSMASKTSPRATRAKMSPTSSWLQAHASASADVRLLASISPRVLA